MRKCVRYVPLDDLKKIMSKEDVVLVVYTKQELLDSGFDPEDNYYTKVKIEEVSKCGILAGLKSLLGALVGNSGGGSMM